MKINTIFLTDFYKVGHRAQGPKDVTKGYSNLTPRGTRLPGCKAVVLAGLQYLIKEYLITQFNENFFNRGLKYVLEEYKAVLLNCLGVENPATDHIEYLWHLKHLPIDIYAVPEGSSVGLGCPMLVITNTDDNCFWLVNYLETLISTIIWGPCTSATKAKRMRQIMEKWAKAANETDLGFINWQGHDFSARGMLGVEAGLLSGLGHLTSFSGTDTIYAILAAQKYYNAPLTVGGSVPATEHAVMCSWNKEDEQETFRHLIEDVYPNGIVSIVSDTWDLWKVCTEYVPALKEKILARNGKVVIRPDSGDPVLIVCGDPSAPEGTPQNKGVLRLLAEAMGTTTRDDGGLPMINGVGVIYGDSIDEDRCNEILRRCVEELGLSPYNVVFGIGSYTYQYVTRDTHGFAIKQTAVVRNGVLINTFKDPITDNSCKKSCVGIPCTFQGEFGKSYDIMTDQNMPGALEICGFQKVFGNGKLLIETTLEEIRKRVAEV